MLQMFQRLLHELLLVVNFLGYKSPLKVQSNLVGHLLALVGEIVVDILLDLGLDRFHNLMSLLVKAQALILTRLPNGYEVFSKLVLCLLQN